MRAFALFLLLFSATSLLSQKIHRSKLYGEWKLASTQLEGKEPVTVKVSKTITFFTNDYLESSIRSFNDSLYLLPEDSIKEIYKISFIHGNRSMGMRNFRSKRKHVSIQYVNDSALQIRAYFNYREQEPFYVSHTFKRTETSAVSKYTKGIFVNTPFLVNTFDSTKVVMIENDNCEIKFKRINNDTTVDYVISGTFHSVKDSILRIAVQREDITVNTSNFNYNSTQGISYQNDTVFKEYNLNKIYFSIDKPRNMIIKGIGGTFMSLGMTYALIGAPLVSADFSKGKIDSQKYFTNAGAGLGAFVFGCLLGIFPGNRTYKIGASKNVNDKNYWYIKNQLVNRIE
ncbi:MAG: hypothetical protein K0S32_744 [Bacteroidetes bacterium]|jgi:hypothetical protein|nr:hypothetical protein [Bacteroidota bacterium]